MKVGLVLVLMTAVLLLGSASLAGAQGLLAGAHKVTITPSGQAWIAGYGENRRSAGAHDDLYCRALVLKSGEDTLAIVGLDLLGLVRPDVVKALEGVKSVPRDRVLVASTHTHSGPDTIGLWGPTRAVSGVDKQYMASLLAKIAECVDAAAKNMQPARIKFASTPVDGISVNAREPASLDRTAAVMKVESADGSKTIATLVNFACHPETLNTNMLTADFAGALYKRIEEKAGGVALFINGALGGMVTVNVPGGGDKGKELWAEAEKVGNTLADKALEAIEHAGALYEVPVKFKSAPLLVPMDNPGFQAMIAAGVLPNFSVNGNVNTQIAAAMIGPAQIATIPGEAYPKVGFEVKKMMKDEPKFVFGLCQDELGYILLEEDFDKELYSYEKSMSVGKKMGPMLLEGLKTLLGEVSPGTYGSVAQWFAALPTIFRADKAGDLKAVYQFSLSGEGGGEWIVAVQNEQISVKEGKAENADLTFRVSAQEWLAIVNKTSDPVQSYMTGKLQVDGDTELAVRFAELVLQ